jgi:hypothetical protein
MWLTSISASTTPGREREMVSWRTTPMYGNTRSLFVVACIVGRTTTRKQARWTVVAMDIYNYVPHRHTQVIISNWVHLYC